jgi:hypothetical protein
MGGGGAGGSYWAIFSALRPSFISANQIRWPPNFVYVLSVGPKRGAPSWGFASAPPLPGPPPPGPPQTAGHGNSESMEDNAIYAIQMQHCAT